MPFGVTPAGPGDAATSDDEAEIIDFQIDPAAILITRGVGENAHVVTLRRDAASIADVVWDSSNEDGPVTFTFGDKVARSTDDASMANWVSTAARSSGKVYAEVVANGNGNADLGIRSSVPSTTDLRDVGLAVDVGTGDVWQLGTTILFATGDWSAGDVAGIALDLNNMRVWISRNGTWLTGDPSSNTAPLSTSMPPGAYYIAGAAFFEGGTSLWIRTIAAEFTQPIPTGFVAFAPT